MSKKAHERSLAENEAQAVARMLRVSPQKLNLVAGLIRGKKVAMALADLDVLMQQLAVFLLAGVPAGIPGPVDAETQTDRIDLLTHRVLLRPLSRCCGFDLTNDDRQL